MLTDHHHDWLIWCTAMLQELFLPVFFVFKLEYASINYYNSSWSVSAFELSVCCLTLVLKKIHNGSQDSDVSIIKIVFVCYIYNNTVCFYQFPGSLYMFIVQSDTQNVNLLWYINLCGLTTSFLFPTRVCPDCYNNVCCTEWKSLLLKGLFFFF